MCTSTIFSFNKKSRLGALVVLVANSVTSIDCHVVAMLPSYTSLLYNLIICEKLDTIILVKGQPKITLGELCSWSL